MPQIINGKEISAQIKEELKDKVKAMKEDGISVCLAVIQVGDDPASSVYVGNKKKACEYVGIESLSYELPEETAADAMKLAQRMMRKMTEKLDCDGFNIVQNNGEAAGQTVFHFHMHLIPRYKNDGEILKYIAGDPGPEELERIKKTLTE